MSMPSDILWVLGLSALVVGSITDIRTREVPDWVSYGLMFAAGGARIILAAANNDWNILLEGLYGFGVFVAIALLMFYAGQWGGGDSKLLMGLGIIFGLTWSLNNELVGFWMNMLLVGSAYGLLYSCVLAYKHRKDFSADFDKRIKGMQNIRIAIIGTSIVLLLIAIFSGDFVLRILMIMIAFFVLGGFYLFVFIKSVEKTCMHKLIKPSELTEGDWIVKDVIIDGKRITGPKDLGIEISQIEELKKLEHKGKIKHILIKEGIPFVPSFLIAFGIQYFWGSLLSFFA